MSLNNNKNCIYWLVVVLSLFKFIKTVRLFVFDVASSKMKTQSMSFYKEGI